MNTRHRLCIREQELREGIAKIMQLSSRRVKEDAPEEGDDLAPAA